MSTVPPLELLHPAGAVERVLTLGESMPPDAGAAVEVADLVLIAPSARQLGETGWLEAAVDRAARTLAPAGLACALVPGRARGRMRRLLQEAGLTLETPIAQLPDGDAPRHLVPLARAPWRDALGDQIGERPLARGVLRAAGRLPRGVALLTRMLPSVAIVARHPGARPLADWIEPLAGRPAAHAVVTTSWRGGPGPMLMRCFADGEARPWGIVKVTPPSAGELGGEALALDGLGESARAAGVRVPWSLASARLGDRAVLVETILDGRPAARVLMASRAAGFGELAGALSGWLESWHRETASADAAASADRLRAELLEPAGELAAQLPGDYPGWLAERCQALAREAPPLVARHNDLTMWNVLVDDSASLGVLDWAEAEPAGLPLTDFFYAIADAAAACDGYRDRLAAVRACFEPAGRHAEEVARLQTRLAGALELRDGAAELTFHACWLRHARNERAAGEAGPFLEIARWAARRATEAA